MKNPAPVNDYDRHRDNVNLILAELDAVLQAMQNKEEPDED